MESHLLLLVSPSPDVEVSLGAALGNPQAVRSVPDVAAARSALAKSKPAVAVVFAAASPGSGAMELVSELAGRGVAVVVQGPQKDADLILAALRAGAREFVTAGEEKQLERVVQRLLESSGAVKLGGVTAVVPAKGGMGATVVATHLAGALVRAGKRVCLVDLDLELGDVLTYLDMTGTYSLADVALNARRLDRDLLDASVPKHASGLFVLSQSDRLAEADHVGAEGVTQVLRFLRHHYDHVVLDGLRDFGDVPLAALEVADRALLVTTQEVPAVRNAQRRADLLRQLGYDDGRVQLVVNRYQRSSPITLTVIEETAKLRVLGTVGNDFHALSQAVNQGVLVWEAARRSVVARDAEALAEAITGSAIPAPRPSLLRALFPRMVTHGA